MNVLLQGYGGLVVAFAVIGLLMLAGSLINDRWHR